jgi:hypothetical protein
MTVSRCVACGRDMPCGCPEQRSANGCPSCGERYHMVDGVCPAVERRARTSRAAVKPPWGGPGESFTADGRCPRCGKGIGLRLHCGCGWSASADQPRGARKRAAPADPRAALAQLEQSMERARRAESRSIRVGRVALELLEARFRDAP